ncbi:MAG: hypothetical protein H0U60_11180 [Blastocatellia bacterium]|nr:hypothetical protein [Blastocatellia bacterium]
MYEGNDAVTEQATVAYSIEQKANVAGVKLYYDTCKHTTTLSTASVLLLLAFLEKLFPTPRWKFVVVLAFGSFILSIFFSVFAMLQFAEIVRTMGRLSEARLKVAYWIFYGSLLLFAWGILCLVFFALINFFFS